MSFRKSSSLLSILDESPFFTELSFKERDRLIRELLKAYPQLRCHISGEVEVGYEASWLAEQSY
jgi:hypothetical protein